MTLLEEIQAGAVDANTDLPTLLRKCRILAARLKNEDFKKWVQHELDGYPSDATLPDYRKLHCQSFGHFAGPFGSGIRNAPIPLMCIPEQFRNLVSTVEFHDGISALQNLGDIGNIASGGSQISQEATLRINLGDWDGLERYLRSLGVDDSDISELKVAVREEPKASPTGFGKKVAAWIGKMISKSAQGIWNVTTTVASNVLSKALGRFYGFPNGITHGTHSRRRRGILARHSERYAARWASNDQRTAMTVKEAAKKMQDSP